jgi:hypothetical protein
MSSCWFFLWLCLVAARGAFFPTFVLPELAVTVVLGLVYFLRRRRFGPLNSPRFVQPPEDEDLATQVYRGIFFLVLACAVVSFILISVRNPHGDYDAWATWNLRARFLARGTAHWRDAFVDTQSHNHANLDYPLLLPSTIAIAWKYAGFEPVSVPMVVAFIFTFSSVGLVCSSLTFLRTKRIGYLGGIVLLGVSSFTDLGTWQYADVVVGFFVLSTIAMLSIYDTSPDEQNHVLLILTGATAGFCAWTKNEGLLFLLLVLGVQLSSSIVRKGWTLFAQEAKAIMSGLLPVLAILLYFKLAVGPANSWVSPVNNSAGNPIQYFLEPGTKIQKLTDISRYWMIARTMAGEIVRLGGRTVGITPLLLLHLFSAKVKRKDAVDVQTGIAILALMMAGYFFVYLVTPLNLAYHLRTSLSRLLLQLWPSFVFVVFMATSAAGVDSIACV